MENFKEVLILGQNLRGEDIEMGQVGRPLSVERQGDPITGMRTLAVESLTLIRHFVVLTHLIL